MPQEPNIYRTFPPEIVSNTFDFDVRWMIHNGHWMRGVFARRSIDASECSLFMGSYPGCRKSREENALKVERYAARHGVDQRTAILKTVAYSLSLRKIDPGYILDPTDEEGELLPECIPYLGLYINEPPPGHPSKAAFVYNQPRQRYEVWLLQMVEQDEEIYLYYGSKYVRDYPINPHAYDDRFSHYIPMESIFRPDRRGLPPLLQVPEWIESQAIEAGSEMESVKWA
jgi:hypothetical protein